MGFFRATIHCREAEPISGLPLAITGLGEVSGDLGVVPVGLLHRPLKPWLLLGIKGQLNCAYAISLLW